MSSNQAVKNWPERLRDESQALEVLPAGRDTDYVLVRVQSHDTNNVIRNLQKVAHDSAEHTIHIVVVKQAVSHWQPKNSWTIARSLFDWVLGHVRETQISDTAAIERKQRAREQRRNERATR